MARSQARSARRSERTAARKTAPQTPPETSPKPEMTKADLATLFHEVLAHPQNYSKAEARLASQLLSFLPNVDDPEGFLWVLYESGPMF